MKRKVIALIMTVALATGAFANGVTDSDSASEGQKTLVFEYFATSFTVQWIQDIEASLKELGAQYNFEVRTADANRKIETQLSQVDVALLSGIDGAFLFVVDEGSAPAVVSKFNDAKVPVIGETLKLKDGSDKVIAPYVELDAEGVGDKCAQWIIDNWKTTGVDLSKIETVGVIKGTNSKYQSDINRANGFVAGLKKGFPGLKDSNIFMADCAAETGSQDMAEASYKQTSAIIASHPEVSAWLVMGTVDHYGLGAARAIEAAGVEKKAILVSAGGELAVKEWANNASPCWWATCYYNAMDYAKYMVEGMLAMCREGKKAEDIFPQFKEAGQKYAVIKISGTMITRDTYKSIVQ
ncbi:substrate-binding domain-containing protein [Sediminispirochaeta smaragdinae]|uniref:ABC-type sugar transport system periplasmic component n=1 Tax=Sediminispirochaeta smaragdinae (strain DSM 11293 / JCM 15392 / SEBR 4228) TaxID=573413 RepID=E1R4U3_SEDSS|nr:substrate-binding domain-containing protein [Sediminispirochaeta smaragdinae]ADK82181.1 ABC-type sugar transport system periplasmic component [Sediminispirochaeta smaragdinae DSM 11293]